MYAFIHTSWMVVETSTRLDHIAYVVYVSVFTYIHMCVYIYIYIYIHISRPRGDRKFGGCYFLGCLGGDFGESVLKERRSERARLD